MVPELDDLSYQFFRQYARFEYSLKASGRLKNGQAEPDWTALAIEVDDQLAQARRGQDEVERAVSYILQSPPRKQVVERGRLAWSDRQPDHQNTADLLLKYISRIRNNLFHGGKFNGHWFDPERSRELLAAGLVVLNCCLELSPEVAAAYHN